MQRSANTETRIAKFRPFLIPNSSFRIRHLPGPLVPVKAVHHIAGDAVFLQHHSDGLGGVERRVALAGGLSLEIAKTVEVNQPYRI